MSKEKKDWRTMSIPEKAKAWNTLIRIFYYGNDPEDAWRLATADEDWYIQSKSWQEHLQRYKQRYLNDDCNEIECEIWAMESYELGEGYLCYMDVECYDNLMKNIDESLIKEETK